MRFANGSAFDAPNLKAVLGDPARVKLYHFARFDLAAIEYYLGRRGGPGVLHQDRQQADAHLYRPPRLEEPDRGTARRNISKQQQSSDWGAPELSDAQKDYAASDVRFLHRLREVLIPRLEREGRLELAQACFDFLPARARLDIAGWADKDIFSHE